MHGLIAAATVALVYLGVAGEAQAHDCVPYKVSAPLGGSALFSRQARTPSGRIKTPTGWVLMVDEGGEVFRKELSVKDARGALPFGLNANDTLMTAVRKLDSISGFPSLFVGFIDGGYHLSTDLCIIEGRATGSEFSIEFDASGRIKRLTLRANWP